MHDLLLYAGNVILAASVIAVTSMLFCLLAILIQLLGRLLVDVIDFILGVLIIDE